MRKETNDDDDYENGKERVVTCCLSFTGKFVANLFHFQVEFRKHTATDSPLPPETPHAPYTLRTSRLAPHASHVALGAGRSSYSQLSALEVCRRPNVRLHELNAVDP